MKYYKVTKDYRGGQSVYYIALNDDEKITDDTLESVGEHTDAGKSYGYPMRAWKIKALPKGAKILARQRTITIY